MKSLPILLVLALGASTFAQVTQSAGASSGITKLYVVPFAETGGAVIRPGWLRSRLNDAIVQDLGAFTTIQLLKPADGQAGPPEGSQAQLEPARRLGAQIALLGTVASSGEQLSVSGDIFDLFSGNSIGTVKAQGMSRDLFKVQDNVVRQVHQLVARIVGENPAMPPRESTSDAARPAGRYPGSALEQAVVNPNPLRQSESPSAGVGYDQTPYHTVEYPGYYYGGDYGWPYYGYPWYGWGWGGSTIIIEQDHHRSHNRAHFGHGSREHWVGGWDNGRRGGDGARFVGGSHSSGFATHQPALFRAAPVAPRSMPVYSGNTMQYSPGYEIRPVFRAPVRTSTVGAGFGGGGARIGGGGARFGGARMGGSGVGRR